MDDILTYFSFNSMLDRILDPHPLFFLLLFVAVIWEFRNLNKAGAALTARVEQLEEEVDELKQLVED